MEHFVMNFYFSNQGWETFNFIVFNIFFILSGMALSSQCPETGKLLVTSEVMELAEHRNPHVQIKLLNKTLAIFR